MFFFIMLFSMPLYYEYGTGIGLKGWKSFPLTRFSMGNLGGSDMFCKSTSLSRGVLKINCPSGTVIDSRNAHFGVISNKFE